MKKLHSDGNLHYHHLCFFTLILESNPFTNLSKNMNTIGIDLILNSSGKLIIFGMGKSGVIGKKIAASFASTGTPSFFLHLGEAYHGDIVMVEKRRY